MIILIISKKQILVPWPFFKFRKFVDEEDPCSLGFAARFHNPRRVRVLSAGNLLLQGGSKELTLKYL